MDVFYSFHHQFSSGHVYERKTQKVSFPQLPHPFLLLALCFLLILNYNEDQIYVSDKNKICSAGGTDTKIPTTL